MIHDLALMAKQAAAEAGTASAEPATRPALANVSRRGILGGAGALVLALSLRSPAKADETQTQEQKEHKYGADGMPHGWRDDPKIFIAIAPDGAVTVTNHRSEMGQGVRTSIALTVADELEADWPKVKVVQAYGTRTASATRTRTARARSATSSSTSATPARRCARCWSRRPRSSGACPPPR